METPTAVKMINDMVYLPGWTLTASDHSARFQGTIRVRVDYPARNTPGAPVGAVARDQAHGSVRYLIGTTSGTQAREEHP